MKYKSMADSHAHHKDHYQSDGIEKGKGLKNSPDFKRVSFVINNIDSNSRVLDVGCNSGTIAIHIINMGCYVNGIDIVHGLVEKAIKNGVYAEMGVAEDLSRYQDDSFDAVICSEVLEHLYDPVIAIKEAYRVLKPCGKYIVTVPHPHSDICKNGELGDFHHQNFSIDDLNHLFSSIFGYENFEMWGIPYSDDYCKGDHIKKAVAQWTGIVGVKK